jgi:DNA-binding response OmpR family regulator
MRILVIEDDREAASYLVKALTEAGHVADLETIAAVLRRQTPEVARTLGW